MKVLLAGKSYLCREGIKQILNEIGYRIIYESENFEHLSEWLKQYNPDITMLEIGQVESENIISLLLTKPKNHPTKLMLFCDNKLNATTLHKIQSKTDSIVNTNASREEILLAFSSMLSGEKYFTPSVIKLLLNENELKEEVQQHQKLFTERETQILQYILKGRSNEQIADILFLSEKTVATHKRNIMKKAKVKKTSDLILFALDKGFGKGASTQIKTV